MTKNSAQFVRLPARLDVDCGDENWQFKHSQFKGIQSASSALRCTSLLLFSNEISTFLPLPLPCRNALGPSVKNATLFYEVWTRNYFIYSSLFSLRLLFLDSTLDFGLSIFVPCSSLNYLTCILCRIIKIRPKPGKIKWIKISDTSKIT